MAHTHEQVADAFASGKKVRNGSRMYNEITHRPLYWPSGDHLLFTEVGRGYSYRTKICQIVVNHHTGLSEMWITPLTYSRTTNGHEDMYRRAFVKRFMYNHGVDADTAQRQVFTTPAVDDASTRCNPHHAHRVIASVTADRLRSVLLPRLRTATRMGALASITATLDNITRRMTHGVPENAIDADTHRELQALSAFVDNTTALYRHDDPKSIDAVRAAVEGYIALSKD